MQFPTSRLAERERTLEWKYSEQGSDLIELRLTCGRWRILFFGDLSEFLEYF